MHDTGNKLVSLKIHARTTGARATLLPLEKWTTTLQNPHLDSQNTRNASCSTSLPLFIKYSIHIQGVTDPPLANLTCLISLLKQKDGSYSVVDI